jgi:competence protein ComEA
VYALPQGARVQDGISAAGGFLAEADKENINLARPLEDGERLDIPYQDGFSPVIPTPLTAPIIESGSELININIASVSELETLPGIGSKTAQKIVEYREKNGLFLSIEDIVNVSGIGPGTYIRIKDLITVGD